MKSLRKIKLTKGLYTTVDESDFDLINSVKWHASKKGSKYYACRTERVAGKKRGIYLHRVIMNPKEGEEVDHIDGNPLNNSRLNLRICNHMENMRNGAVKKKRVGKCKYKGVYKHAKNNTFIAQIRLNNRSVYLGSFKTEKEAAQMYNKEAVKWFGKFAKLNKIDD